MSKEKFFSTTHHNQVEFFFDGDPYCEKYVALIRSSRESIHLQTYIFELGTFGDRVFKELILAAQRGVKVYLLIDSVGSRGFPKEAGQELIAQGVHFAFFNGIQLKWLYRWGRRLHHKILLIDEAEAMVGGINICSFHGDPSCASQLDFAVYLRGPVTVDLYTYCQRVFKKSYPAYPEVRQASFFFRFSEGYDVGISVNDWSYGHSKITAQYMRITQEARSQITIINSYFFPRKKFMRQLVAAVKRGVRVRLILPKDSDWPNYVLASEYLYDYFLKRGVEIYQWKKSILHGKLATVDDSWTTVGSFNLNYTSYQQNLEMNVDIYSRSFTEALNNKIDQLITHDCEKINETFYSEASFKTKFFRLVFYLIMVVIANCSVGLSFQEDPTQNRYLNMAKVVGAVFFFCLGIVGVILPVMPASPFFLVSFLLVSRQIMLNKKKT